MNYKNSTIKFKKVAKVPDILSQTIGPNPKPYIYNFNFQPKIQSRVFMGNDVSHFDQIIMNSIKNVKINR